MAGNTPEGIRHLMYHRPMELYKATKRLVELSHDKLGLQRGLVITTQRLEIVDGEGKHLCVAAATLAALRLHKDGLSVEFGHQAPRALKPEFGGGDGATRKYWGDAAIATQAWIGDRAPEAWSKLQEAVVDIASTARTAAEGAELMTKHAGHMQPSSAGPMDFGIQAEDVREDALPGERQPEPRSKTSPPKTQPKDATREVKLDLELTAAKRAKK